MDIDKLVITEVQNLKKHIKKQYTLIQSQINDLHMFWCTRPTILYCLFYEQRAIFFAYYYNKYTYPSTTHNPLETEEFHILVVAASFTLL